MNTGLCLRSFLLAVGCAGLLSNGSTRLPAAEPPVRVLLFSGQNNHDWRQTTPKIKSILTTSDRFTVDITERPDQCNAATFARYDVIVSDWNTFPADAKVKEWPAQMREAFLSFIRNGGGHVVVHSGSSSFEGWAEYRQLSGSAWGKGTGHGPIHTFEVRMVEDHPITRGLEPFHITDELWHQAEVQPRTVLATAFSSKDKGGSNQDEPVAMVTEFGRGRGFTLLLGHDFRAMDAPGFQTLLLRGTEWAAMGKVTFRGSHPESVIDAALRAAATYRFGDNRQALATVEKLVQSVSTDPVPKQQLAGKLAALLTSEATVEAKQFACGQLSLIGSATEVPILARVLGDTNLSFYARLALERIPGGESLDALRAALAGASGPLQLELINSLASRWSEKSVPDLARLVLASDPGVASAAIRALGTIRGPSAAQALLSAERSIPAALQPQWADSLLHAAQRLLAAGTTGEALPILEKLTTSEAPSHIRVAAFPLRVQALGDRGAQVLLAALGGQDKAMQTAAIRALRMTRSDALLRAAASRLDSLPSDLQVPVLTLLGERGGSAALPAVIQATASKDAAVRRAAIVALGSIGSAEAVPVLTRLTEAADNEERKLIAEALTRLSGAGVDAALVAELKKAPPGAQTTLIRALTARSAKTAIPALIDAASSPDAQVRREALAGLEKIGDTSACAPLLGLLETAGDTGAIESALVEICRREGSADPVINVVPGAPAAKKGLLLGMLAAIGGTRALETVRVATRSGDRETQTAAVRALADWPEAAPLDDLAAIADTTPEAKLKALALRGVARLAPLAKGRSGDSLAGILDHAMSGAATAEQKALLGALGEVPSLSALKVAAAQLKNPELADEAGFAVLKIVEQVGQKHRAEARTAIERVQAACKNPSIAERAQAMSYKFGDLENLSLTATATSPDDLEKDGAANGDQAAIDGKTETYWDEADNQKLYRLRVQLKQPSRVVFLRLMGWQQHNHAPKDFEILCDGQVVKKVTNATYKNNWLEVSLPPTGCAVVELKITGYYPASPAIRELEIYGKPSDGKDQSSSNNSGYRWDETATSLALLNGAKVIWRAHFDRQLDKPFFHPIALPDGTELTALRPADHPWHLAGWWSWKFIDGLNYWEPDPKTGQTQGQTEIISVRCTTQADPSASIEMQLGCRPRQGTLVLKEFRILKITGPDAAGSYRMDWASTFSPVNKSVTLERTPISGQPDGVAYGGYAGLSIRMAAETRSWIYSNSEGVTGEQATHGKPARWLDFSGRTAAGSEGGVAILDHPANLRHPSPWYVNQDMPYFSPAVLFNAPYTVAAGTNLTLRYRMLIHPGLLSRTALDLEWDDFRKL